MRLWASSIGSRGFRLLRSGAVELLKRLVLIVFFSVALVATAAIGTLGFTTQVTQNLIAAYVKQFGGAARQRLESWVAFGRSQKGTPGVARLLESTAGPDIEALKLVNGFFNRVPWLTDLAHWGVEDYWATPAEMSASNGGDCEDFSIAKYFLLKELGVPIERLRVTYVKALKINQAHMVLAYYASPGADPLILDNLENEVRPASQRSDLVPVYSFNDDDVVIVRDARKASSMQIRAWRDLIEKLQTESRL